MFKIGLENREFCKSLHFYIVDAEKKKKKKKKKRKKKKKNELHLLACSAALGPLGPSASPEGRCPHFFFSCAAGRLPAQPLIYISQQSILKQGFQENPLPDGH